ncbi:MAG: M48 family metallopeptidase [Deltaproteobacteria bacterium]|nr:MAG: M48 family metallopeptidase [Deltaproteobacteria bacterium]
MDPRAAQQIIEQLNRDAERIAGAFGLRYQSIEAERSNVKRRYGICFADGSIRIRLRHATSGRALKYSSLVNTLCHELAHLRHFNHGKRFRAFYLRLLEFARAEGIYRPGLAVPATPRPAVAAERAPARRRRAAPEQRDLFA